MHSRVFAALFGLLGISAAGASAQTVSECDWRASSDYIPVPHEQHIREFSNGNVRLTLLDTAEPANAAFHLMITSPPYDADGTPQCRLISRKGNLGFAGVYFQDLTADYDPAVGLIFHMPFVIYLPEQEFTNSGKLVITLNQATGEIKTEQMLAE